METFFSAVANNEFFQNNIALWWGYFPLGVIGAWRWSVWCFKKAISFFYRLPSGEYSASLSVVAPVYNEDPEMFKRALESWKKNKPEEIIAVIDYTDKACIKIFEAFKKNCPGAKMIVTHTPGKRAALALGIKASTSEIVALVDSDTLWTKGLKKKVLGPFQDAKVGGVAPRQDVIHADTLAKRLFRIHIFNRCDNDILYQAAFGNALSCISGRTGIYRFSAIAHLTDELENEKFLGKKCISGDDKRLTTLIQRDGWHVKYVRNALVYTPGSSDVKTYTKQQIRWTRNSWRSDLKAIFTRWLWKNPFLAFHTIDRFVGPFTLLLGPIFFGIALYRGDFLIAFILVCWWLISRSLKILPHFIKHPEDIAILPIHIMYGFFLAIVKIYTLITVSEQGWITRWDKSRLNRLSFLKNAADYSATFSVVFLLFFVSYNTNNHAFSHTEFLQRKAVVVAEKADKKLYKIENPSQFMIADEAISQARLVALHQKVDADSFGYYQIQWGETQNDVRRKFFLRPETIIFRENKVALGPASIVRAGDRIAIAIQDLRNPDMESYRQKSPARFIVTNYLKQNAVRVIGKGSFVTIADLTKRINNKAVIENLGDKQFIIRKNIFIDNGVTLIIDGDSVDWLKLKSDSKGFVWIKSENGNIVIRNTKITSWDETLDDYDKNWEDGRGYILQKLSGRMDISNSDISYLGYFGAPNRGNPYGGPYGISWKIANGSFRNELSTGVVTNNTIHHNLFGIYTYGVTGASFVDNEVFDNVKYGIDPHDDSNHLLIESNQTFRNGSHGIIISKRCFSNIIRGNLSHGNALHGIMLDHESNNNLVENNYLSGNVNGVALNHSFENIIAHNSLTGNDLGIRASNESQRNFFGENVIDSSRKGIYVYQNSFDTYIFRNIFLHDKLNVHSKEHSDIFFIRVVNPEVLQQKKNDLFDFLNKVL